MNPNKAHSKVKSRLWEVNAQSSAYIYISVPKSESHLSAFKRTRNYNNFGFVKYVIYNMSKFGEYTRSFRIVKIIANIEYPFKNNVFIMTKDKSETIKIIDNFFHFLHIKL